MTHLCSGCAHDLFNYILVRIKPGSYGTYKKEVHDHERGKISVAITALESAYCPKKINIFRVIYKNGMCMDLWWLG